MAAPEVFNYCPFCGSPLKEKEFEGQVRPFCAHCDRPFFHDPKVAAAVLIEQEEKILLVQRSNVPGRGMWTLPAGFVDAGEDPKETARRECFEETGLQVKVTDLVDLFFGKEHERGADFVLLYRGVVEDGQLVPGDDAMRVGFFSAEELPTLAFHATHKAIALWRSTISD